MDAAEVSRRVAEIIAGVRRWGDEALIEYTERWDGVRLTPETLRVPEEVLAREPEDTPFARAFRRAVERIRAFHAQVKPRSFTVEDAGGASLSVRWTPLESAGLYVPGGKASYPSTLAMTGVPAQIAGVERIAVVSPPGPGGEVSPEVLLAARILGLREVYRAGGAQAVAALALGTRSVPRVDKIFGPGNAYVAEAKRQLFGTVGIDVVAGPSELVVYADESSDPEWVAADLLAQAEHEEGTRVTLLASSTAVRDSIRERLERRLRAEPRRETIARALEARGAFEVVADDREAALRINEIAPEHLSIQVRRPEAILPLVRHAGAIYLGGESPVAAGDYYAGPNHVLPTGGAARYASVLSTEDYMKRSNVVRLPLEFVRQAAADIDLLARGERLPAHAASVNLRRLAGEVRPRGGLRRVTPYPLVEEEGEVKLNQNEAPWDIPEEIKDEVARRLRDLPWHRYHQRIPQELGERIAAGLGLAPECVITGSGSNLLLQWVFDAYAGPGSTVLLPEPSFALYPLWAAVTESRALGVELGEDFQYDASLWAHRLREVRPELAVLCLPNNPTGSELEPRRVRELAEILAGWGGLLAVDEAYREFSDARHDRTALVNECGNVVLVRTCSKAYAAAGMRLGYLLAPPPVARELRKLVPPFHLNLFAAVLGLVLWERKELFAERVRRIIAERDRLLAALARLPGVRAYPSQANFLLFRTSGAARIQAALEARGVLVRRPAGSRLLEDCLRVNAGTPEENDRFLQALEEALKEDAHGR